MTVEEAIAALRGIGLVAEDKRGSLYPPLTIQGGESETTIDFHGEPLKAYDGAYNVCHEGDRFIARLAGTPDDGFLVKSEEGDLEHVIDWIIGHKKKG